MSFGEVTAVRHLRILWLLLLVLSCDEPRLDAKQIANAIRTELSASVPEEEIREKLLSWGAEFGEVDRGQFDRNSAFWGFRPYPEAAKRGLTGFLFDNPENWKRSKYYVQFAILIDENGRSVAADARALTPK